MNISTKRLIICVNLKPITIENIADKNPNIPSTITVILAHLFNFQIPLPINTAKKLAIINITPIAIIRAMKVPDGIVSKPIPGFEATIEAAIAFELKTITKPDIKHITAPI